jgi:hypothetical protein
VTKTQQQVTAFVFGVVFVLVLLAVAFAVPNPSDFQYVVFKTVLALAAAGAAAMIPGFIHVTISKFVRAGGALAVFAIVFFYSPAAAVRANVPALQAEVTLDAGTYEVSALIARLGALTGGLILDDGLSTAIKNKVVSFSAPIKDVSLQAVLDQVFRQVGITVEYKSTGNTVVIRKK